MDTSAEHRILEAARTEFRERGYRAARMQAIADRAGVNKALIHYYFSSKEGLFRAVQDMLEADWGILTQALVDHQHPRQVAEAFFPGLSQLPATLRQAFLRTYLVDQPGGLAAFAQQQEQTPYGQQLRNLEAAQLLQPGAAQALILALYTLGLGELAAPTPPPQQAEHGQKRSRVLVQAYLLQVADWTR